MAFTIFRSSDVGAPVLKGVTGALVTVFDACLTTGYGSKSGLGWTKDYSSGATLAVYRMPTGLRFYLQVNDYMTTDSAINAYESMTAVNSGTGPFPSAGSLYCRKSSTVDATPRTWALVGDDRTFYFFSQTGETSNSIMAYYGIAFGEFYSFKANDDYRCLLIARTSATSQGDYTYGDLGNLRRYDLTNLAGHYLARGYTAQTSSIGFTKHGNSSVHAPHVSYPQTLTSPMMGNIPFPNPTNGGFLLSPIWIIDTLTSPTKNIRGVMRGLRHWLHPTVGVLQDKSRFIGADELSGKTFEAVYPLWYTDSSLGTWDSSTTNYTTVNVAMLETSDTVLTN